MYKFLFNAVEKSINILIEAQRECEEIYVSEISITKELERRKLEKKLNIISNVEE